MRIRDRGFALMLVLVAAAGAFALATQASLTMRANTSEASAAIERADAQRRARSAVVVALTGLLTPANGFDEGASKRERAERRGGGPSSGAPNTPIETDEEELELPAIVKELLGGGLKQVEDEEKEREERREQRDDRNGGLNADASVNGVNRRLGIGLRQLERFGLPPRPVTFTVPGDDATFTIEFADAVGLLDLNSAEEQQLTTYLTLKGVDPGRAIAIAQQILDWRDEDEFVRQLGAERANYAGSGIEIANANFTALEQLLFLPSMTREIYADIRRDVILSGTGVHANSAPLEVLASVPGMSVAFAERILQQRAIRPINDTELRAMAPPSSEVAMAYLRTKPTSLVRLSVVMEGEGTRVFEGYALLDDSSVRAITLRPLYDQTMEPTP